MRNHIRKCVVLMATLVLSVSAGVYAQPGGSSEAALFLGQNVAGQNVAGQNVAAQNELALLRQQSARLSRQIESLEQARIEKERAEPAPANSWQRSSGPAAADDSRGFVSYAPVVHTRTLGPNLNSGFNDGAGQPAAGQPLSGANLVLMATLIFGLLAGLSIKLLYNYASHLMLARLANSSTGQVADEVPLIPVLFDVVDNSHQQNSRREADNLPGAPLPAGNTVVPPQVVVEKSSTRRAVEAVMPGIRGFKSRKEQKDPEVESYMLAELSEVDEVLRDAVLCAK